VGEGKRRGLVVVQKEEGQTSISHEVSDLNQQELLAVNHVTYGNAGP
jgi:hypothetical protein